MNKDYEEQESTEIFTEKIIRNDKKIHNTDIFFSLSYTYLLSRPLLVWKQKSSINSIESKIRNCQSIV